MDSLPTVRVTPLRCGALDWPAVDFVDEADGFLRLPVWSFLLEHPDGLVVFDTGMHPSLRDDPASRLGERPTSYALRYGPGDDVAARLVAAGVEPGDVTTIVCSHLHWDHCGGNALLDRATVVVQRTQWEQAHRAGAQRRGYISGDVDTGQRVELLDGARDLFGDGSVVCVPTPGHCPGHQSLRVAVESGVLLLAADACMLAAHLRDDRGASFDEDAAAQRKSLDMLRAARSEGATIVFGHDELSSEAAGLLEPEPPR